MNDKDMQAFDKWHDENITNPPTLNELINRAWIGACEYKQKEIDELLKQLKHEHDLYKKHLKIYEDENAKLRECVEFYADAKNWEGREIDGDDWHDFYEDGNGIGGKRAIEFIRSKNK